MKSQMWLLDPRPNLPSIVRAVEDGFELSEATHTPVMLQLRIRACHVHGHFIAKDNRRPAYSIDEALASPRRDVDRIVLPPASFLHEREKIEQRWPAAQRFIAERGLNEFFAEDAADVGIIVQGGLYNSLLRAMERLGLADVYGRSKLPLYVMNVAYPLVDDGAHALLRRQARRAAGGGRPAQLHRAGHRQRAAPARPADQAGRQGTRSRWPANTAPRCCTRACAPSSASTCPAGCRPHRPRCIPLKPMDGARAPAGPVHRLPGAPGVRRAEAGPARTRRTPCQRRHRLPPVLDPAALPHRQHHHGLRPGRGRRGGLQHAVEPSAPSASWATAASGTTA